MSDANAVNIAFVAESTFGEVPSGPPTLQDLRFTSDNFKLNTATTVSNEVRSDRQITDFVRTNLSAAGDLNWELSYGTYDTFWQAFLLSSGWSSPVTVTASTISIESIATSSSSNPKVKDSANGFGSVNLHQWIKITGAGTSTNNVVAKVVAKASNGEIDIAPANSGGDMTDEAAGSSITVTQGGQIVNGTTFQSFAIEKEYTDLANTFDVFTGMTIDTMSLTVTPEAILNGTFGFQGKNLDPDNTATVGDGSNTAASTTEVMNAVDNVTAVLENLGSYDITELVVNGANNLRQRLIVGELGPQSMGTGRINVSGNVNTYMDLNSRVQFQKYANFTTTAIAFVMTDDAGNVYVMDLPAVKYGDGETPTEGINTDVMVNLSFQAFRNSTENVTMRMVRFPV